MKKMIFGLALIATCVASANTVTSANTFGVLKINSSDEETVICVPWVKVGGGNIDADSLVLTSNLKAGDQLYACHNGTYYTWTLSAAGGKWGEVTTVGSGSLDASDLQLPRGTGLILIRKDSTGWTSAERAEKPIYLYGQYIANDSPETAVTANAFNLIAPPSTAVVDLNSANLLKAGTSFGENDVIITALGQNLIRNNNQWVKATYSQGAWSYSTTEAKIPAGRGFWYWSKSGAPTFVW